MFQPQMRVGIDQAKELWPMIGGYTYPWDSTVEWPACSMTIPNPLTPESWTLRTSYDGIFILLQWSQSYRSMLSGVSSATASKHCVTHPLDSTCYSHRLLPPGRDLPWTKLPTGQSERHWDTLGSCKSSTIWLKWRLSSSGARMLTAQS